MKKIYFLLLVFNLFTTVKAQIVNIPDANFKAKLLEASATINIAQDLSGRNFAVDANGDGEIQVSEAQNVSSFFNLVGSNISSLEGISFFSKLTYLNCSFNKLTSLNLIGLVNLKNLYCNDNQLTSLDVTALLNLESLDCTYNKLTSLNLVGLVYLKNLNCRDNKLTALDVTSLANLKELWCNYNQLQSLNVIGLVNLKYLDCSSNLLTSLDVTTLKNLEILTCFRNGLISLNVNGLENLKELDCYINQLTSLELIGLVNLTDLECSHNQLTSLDLADQINLNSVFYESNNLKNLFIKNTKLSGSSNFSGNKNLEYICVNENQLSNVQSMINILGYTNCQVNTYCSFTPGGIFYAIKGESMYDANNNGCDNLDDNLPNLSFSITDGINKGNIFSNATGNYSIHVGEGTQTITPIVENPNYFTVSPPSISVTFPTQTSPFIQNFCITPNGVHNDLEITILPTIPARPGFDATYKIIYKNKGNQTQSGSVNLSFNDAVMDYVSSIPMINNQLADKLTWDYATLQPFETREITVVLNVNSPMETPAVNMGDRLSFNALINPVSGDEKPVDNSAALRQSVVGSFDPNDKTCLEGDSITPSLIGEYVHYLIRFENTGTYPAQNIVVKDLIDLSKFDIPTLIPTKASHDFVTKISDGNKVEFIFENINLPFDNATNDGYIAFKIKTLPTLVVGDSFQNEANIYFDYNFPILTNTAKSTFQNLGTQDFQFSDYFSLYPNPVNDIINIETKSTIEVKSMAVYDILGQIIIAVPDAKTVSTIDVSKLASGNYFLKMNTNKGTSNMKFIKK